MPIEALDSSVSPLGAHSRRRAHANRALDSGVSPLGAHRRRRAQANGALDSGVKPTAPTTGGEPMPVLTTSGPSTPS